MGCALAPACGRDRSIPVSIASAAPAPAVFSPPSAPASEPTPTSSADSATDAASTTTTTAESADASVEPDENTERTEFSIAETYRGQPVDSLIRTIAARKIVRVLGIFRSTSLVYHLQLEGGQQIGFKPAIPGQEYWWQHEVIAYRLARLLGISDRVPPAVVRRVALITLGPYAAELRLPAGHRPVNVPGAAIYWVPVLAFTRLHTRENRRQWRGWLDPTRPLPEEHRALAKDIATAILFDYLQANEDRWNLANIRADEFGRLVLRDNNVGWFRDGLENLSWGSYRLRDVKRMPRSLIQRIEQVDARALVEELAHEPGGRRLLDDRSIRAFDRRRRFLLRHVREVRQHYGDAAVFMPE
jgi:hypothetical protein